MNLLIFKNRKFLILFSGSFIVLGFLASAIVMAAIPDGNGQINACYNNQTKVLRVTESAGNCASNSTFLSWSQNGSNSGTVFVRDNNGQVLGTLLDSHDTNFSVYNQSVNRIIDFKYSAAGYYIAGVTGFGPSFQSNDCSGQAYIYGGGFVPNVSGGQDIGIKTKLLRTGPTTYGIVQDGEQNQTLAIDSSYSYDQSTDTFNCIDHPSSSDQYYPITNTTVPFNTPITTPFKL